MGTILQFYLGAILLTGLCIYQMIRPTRPAHWLVFAGLSAFWPVAFAIAVHAMLTNPKRKW